MKKKSEVIKYNIIINSGKEIFNYKKLVKGTIVSGNASAKEMYISYRYKNKDIEVLMEGCRFAFHHEYIYIDGFVKEKGLKSFIDVSLECIPIK